MVAKPATLIPYTPDSLPLLGGGEGPYMQRELLRIKAVLDSMQLMTPQRAVKAPAVLADCMIRYAASPFWPVAGQAADAWVWYDLPNAVWKFL